MRRSMLRSLHRVKGDKVASPKRKSQGIPMGIFRSVYSGIGVLALFMAGAVPAQPENDAAISRDQILAHPEVRGALAAIDAWIEGVLIYDEVPGISVGIVHDQDLIWSSGYFRSIEATGKW